jgi:hypothetical protein
MKTQQAGKVLVGAVVIHELWRLAVAVQLPVVASRVHKWSINLFTNPTPPAVTHKRDDILSA